MRATVPFDEGDIEGIVFFGNYFRLAHRALEQTLPQWGIPWKDWFKHPDWGVPLRHVEADYLKPLRPGDEYEVRVTIKELGESSVHFNFEFISQGATVARLKTSHVFVRRPDMVKIPVPDPIRKCLAEKL